jgi:transcriptional regulator with XRE-family HTH domain
MTLREYLKASGITQEEFARQIGVHAVTVNRWVTGGALPLRLRMEQIRLATRGQVLPASFYEQVGVHDG